jgi:D-beta-D-heptose 7-phosphate kinase/D-beta-D-heptose 1-phosphate adenosyltransferase
MKIWMNGCFDILHHGHFRMIEYAASLGTLVIGVDTDERIKKMKGMDRPYHTLEQRIFNLRSIKGVYTVVSFNSDNELIRQIQLIEPDIFVIGSDYKNKPIIGSEYVKEIRYFDRLDNFSTTDILNYEHNSNR